MIDPLMQQQTETVRERAAELLPLITPGPWEWKPMLWPSERCTALRSTTAYYEEYRGVPRGVLKRIDGSSEADEALIALAPDMAAALIAAVKERDWAIEALAEQHVRTPDEVLADIRAELLNEAAMREWARRKQGEPESGSA